MTIKPEFGRQSLQFIGFPGRAWEPDGGVQREASFFQVNYRYRNSRSASLPKTNIQPQMPNGMFNITHIHGKQQMIAPVRAMLSPDRRAREIPPTSCKSESTNITEATKM
jgi:hypothetical protein